MIVEHQRGIETQAPADLQAAGRLRVLVLDECLPYPPDSGKAIRTWNLLKLLSARHEITFLCHGDPGDPGVNAAKTSLAEKGIGVELAGRLPVKNGVALYADLLRNCASRYPYSVAKHSTNSFRAKLAQLLVARRFDLVHCEWTPYARYVLDHAAAPPCVIDAHNIEALIWERRATASSNFAARIFFRDQALKMRRFEQLAFERAAAVATVSDLELNTAHQWGAEIGDVVHNGVDIHSFVPADTVRNNELIFLGSLDWFPNQEAIRRLLRIFPTVKSLRPGSCLRIIGRRPTAELRKLIESVAGVELSADVADVRPYLQSAAALVVPLSIGGGTRIKILEAMACACPVISTSVGCEGLEITNEKDILVADDDAALTAACVRLLSHPSEGKQLGLQARKKIEAQYSWESASLRLDSLWKAAAGVRSARVMRHA